MYFPILAILACIPALLWPEVLVLFKSAIIPMLALIMFSMGLTQTKEDFLRVLSAPKAVGVGLFLQYTLMPLLAFSIGKLLSLDPDLAVGLIIVGCCAGGTASNVMTFLAKGNVALSITLTLASTLLGVLLTPLLIQFYAGQIVEVPVLPMLITICKIVLLPVVAGTLMRYWFSHWIKKVEHLLPHIAILLIVTIIAIVVALNASKFSLVSGTLILAIMLHNSLGLFIGYAVARWFGFSEKDIKAIAIEVGMQNSGLGVALSIKYFSALTALPGALFSIWHNISGSILAAYWIKKNKANNR
jgi:BASS family bile acid:Na+ symporter